MSRAPTSRISCFAGVSPDLIPMFSTILRTIGESPLARIATLNVVELGSLTPNLLICDIDRVEVDGLELLRQIRFVLPNCVIAVYSSNTHRLWARDCHLAGANGLLSSGSSEEQLADGIGSMLSTGCYTDPRFAA
jgi:DNA-binding NarL/FixJ family response regulator